VTLPIPGTYEYRDDRNKDLSSYRGTLVVAAPTSSPSPGTTGGAPPAPADATVRMAGRAFRPSTVSIAVGGSVTWLNDDSRDHTATSSSNAFDSGLMAPGARFVRAFTAVGTYSYLCLIHPDMTGTVVVSGLPGTTPPPATPPPAPTPVPLAAAADVEIVDFAFSPGDFTVDVGTRVTFANRGAALHTVTARDGSFDSGLIRASGTYRRVFATPGTFPYLCTLHPAMSGTIRVRSATGAAAPPQPRPTPAAAAPPGSVRMVDFDFLPAQVRVSVGSTVTWVNEGVAPHTVTATGGEFDSGLMASRASFSYRFSSPGAFSYLCAIHPAMTGTVLVAASEGSLPLPDAGGGGPPGTGEAPAQGGPGPGAGPVDGSGGAGSGPEPGSGPGQAGGDPSAGSPGRAPASIAIGLALIGAAIGGALAVVRGLGRRAAAGV
jgi:plastocyanin